MHPNLLIHFVNAKFDSYQFITLDYNAVTKRKRFYPQQKNSYRQL